MSNKNPLNDKIENARDQQNLKAGKSRMPMGTKKPKKTAK